MGGILEGVPAGFPIDSDAIAAEMALRKPTGRIGTPRREKDEVELVQGVTDGRADGRPILIRIANGDTDGSKYMKFYDTPRPGHADLPALLKFPDHDLRGSGQFSGRLTAAIVAAGAIAKQVIAEDGISVDAFTRSVGDVVDGSDRTAEDARGSRSYATRACDGKLDDSMRACIESAGADGDSVGGIIETAVGYRFRDGRIVTESNHLGGIVGGMCDGAPVVFRTVFKATPSIGRRQDTVNLRTESDDTVEVTGRHDPCIVPRAVAVVEAMAALTVADQIARGY